MLFTSLLQASIRKLCHINRYLQSNRIVDLRAFFSDFIERERFQIFHYLHSPETSGNTLCQIYYTSYFLRIILVENKPLDTYKCLVQLQTVRDLNELIARYNSKTRSYKTLNTIMHNIYYIILYSYSLCLLLLRRNRVTITDKLWIDKTGQKLDSMCVIEKANAPIATIEQNNAPTEPETEPVRVNYDVRHLTTLLKCFLILGKR